MGALAWDSWIGEKGDVMPTQPAPPTPPPVLPETDKARVHDTLLVNIISLLLTSSMEVLNEVYAMIVRGCDRV